MQFKLLPCTAQDSEEVIRVLMSAYSKNALNIALYNNNPSDREAGTLWLIEKAIEAGEGFDASERKMKVVDEDTGKIAGFSIWNFPHKFTEEEIERKKSNPISGIPPMANQEIVAQIKNWKRADVDAEKDFVLYALAVDPTYQTQGVGRLLTNWGLSHVDNADARCFLEATPAGYPIYQRYGWEEVPGHFVEFRFEGNGSEDVVHRTVCMMRPRRSERLG